MESIEKHKLKKVGLEGLDPCGPNSRRPKATLGVVLRMCPTYIMPLSGLQLGLGVIKLTWLKIEGGSKKGSFKDTSFKW